VHNLDLILTLAGGFTAALILGYFTQRAGLSPIVGYLLAGTLVGPHTPGFVANAEIAEQLAEVGVILLMFGVGLQFHIEELLAVRRVAIPGAIAQSAVATVLGAIIARSFGWSWAAGIVFGMALAVASTVVLIRVLADHRDLHTPTGHIAVGWLVVEDLFTVLALVLLPVLFADSGSESSIIVALGVTVLKVAALVGFAAVVGTRVIPYVLDHVADTGSRELFTLTVLTLALGIAVGSAIVFGVSMALGAFLAGLVVGRSDYSLRAASEALPMRDAFAVLFFVAVGMLLSPRYLLEAPALILATLAVVMIGKPLIALVIVRLLGYPFKVALSIAVALSQIGEFSFILSSLGRELNILPPEATNTLVAASIVSIVFNPILYRTVPHIDRWAAAHPRLWKLLNPPLREGATGAAVEQKVDPGRRAVVIGYGPTGRTMVRLLRDNGIVPAVIELNMDTVRRLREQGIDAVYGDATKRDTLEAADASNAGTVILTSAGMGNAAEVIRMARELNPKVQVLARAAYLRDLAEMQKAGADRVFTGEGEVALGLIEAILERLGATAEQIDRERERAHRELFGQEPAESPAELFR
jgi:CPA2 family monovalent cation:H+ antiporter-2